VILYGALFSVSLAISVDEPYKVDQCDRFDHSEAPVNVVLVDSRNGRVDTLSV
jgi:hypothetical protein